LQIDVTGAEADRVVRDESNLAYKSFLKFFDHINQPAPGLNLSIELQVPLSRGLGSSATAIVGGLVGANVLAGSPLTQEQVMEMAIAIEGHPDNVVPALLGGCRLAAESDGDWTICELPCHPDIAFVLGVPDFEVSTAEARRVLPQEYSRADAIFNMAHLGLLVRGLETGNPDWLRSALKDRIHQPYRKSLMHGFDAVREGAIAAGAYELVISGAGPTLLAIAHPAQGEPIAQAMQAAWTSQSIQSEVKVLKIDPTGTRIE
jgi:homoserine kinase